MDVPLFGNTDIFLVFPMDVLLLVDIGILVGYLRVLMSLNEETQVSTSYLCSFWNYGPLNL